MKTRKLTYLAAIALAVGLLAGLPDRASALNFNDSHDLGNITPPEPAGPTDEEHYVNTLINHAAGTFTDLYGGVLYTYSRTSASCGTCPAAVFNSKVDSPTIVNGAVTINLGSGGFTYLLAKYDGPNGADEVWNIQGLTGNIKIPGYLGMFAISHYSLFGPSGGSVPDGGATVMLLGAALGALGMARRFIKR
jgi:VPDSG-CTERM motif